LHANGGDCVRQGTLHLVLVLNPGAYRAQNYPTTATTILLPCPPETHPLIVAYRSNCNNTRVLNCNNGKEDHMRTVTGQTTIKLCTTGTRVIAHVAIMV
jgi:hypothetical protein